MLIDWLIDEWLPDGPPVCLVDGFSGVGKSRMARALLRAQQLPAVLVDAPERPGDIDDFLVEIAVGLQDIGLDGMAAQEEGNLAAGLPAVIRSPFLLVVDSFERLLLPATGMPLASVWNNVLRAARVPGAAGRILLLSNTSLPGGAWEEDVAVRTLLPPEEDEAVVLLSSLLTERGLEAEVSADVRPDVVRWLGRNPRAIAALVACLREDPLDELIALNREEWDLRETTMSAALVRTIEGRFAGRVLGRLSTPARALVDSLAVYRRQFTADAFDQVRARDDARRELTRQFVLDRDRRWYSLNPVARELAAASLVDHPDIARRAHKSAGDHYLRHFIARGGVQLNAETSRNFVEARYHLAVTGRESEFASICAPFRGILLQRYRREQDVPRDPAELRELIATLWAILDGTQAEYPEVRHLLARALLARAYPGDDIRALQQLAIATRVSTSPALWTLRVQLTYSLEGGEAAHILVRQTTVPLAEATISRIYWVLINATSEHGDTSQAIALATEGIARLPEHPEFSSALYQQLARVLMLAGRHEDAVDSLLTFVDRHADSLIAGEQFVPLKRVLERAIMTCMPRRNLDYLEKVRARMESIAGLEQQLVLAEATRLLCEGRYGECASMERNFATYTILEARCAFAALCARNPQLALSIVRRISVRNAGAAWITAIAELCGDSLDAAQLALDRLFRRGPGPSASPESLIEAWANNAEVGYNFPWLPAELLGTDRELRHPLVGDQAPMANVASEINLPRVTPVAPTASGPEAQPSPQAASTVINATYANFGKDVSVTASGGDQFLNIDSSIGAQGSNASASQFTQGDSSPLVLGDLQALSRELGQLRDKAAATASSAADFEVVTEIARAEEAAANGDETTTVTSLRKAGKRALDIAQGLGVGLAVAAIRHATGM